MSTEWESPDPAELVDLPDESAWRSLRNRYDPNHLDRPYERCLEVARACGAKTAAVETRYVDLDYRSEYSSFFSKTFGQIPDTAHRLHFFKARLRADRLTSLTATAVQSYVGYMVIRPSPLGRVGRTVLTPPPDMTAAVQCAVADTVHFFGQDLVVRGVPFAQQDTQFGRCAHVAAWICHYAAALRGDAARRPMAEFSLLADHGVAEGRPLPSQGLTGLQLSNLMREFGLPPIVYRMGALPTSGQEPPVPDHDPNDDPGLWDTRAVAVMCRFLNSGYPVLVGTHDHAFVVIGYQRKKRDDAQWIEFVRHDDQRGPYLKIEDILHDVDPATGDQHTPWQLILAPVPDKLWLLPEAAERAGRTYLLAYDKVEGSGTLEGLQADDRLTFRTLAMPAADYKRAATSRGLQQDVSKELRLARLSRMVWILEAIDRDLRRSGKPCVLGEVVFDSTSSDIVPTVLAIRVPGAVLIHQTDGTIRSPLPAGSNPIRSASASQP